MDYAKLLNGKRVFITTGARGIGKEIAVLFAKHGAVIAVAGKNEVKLIETEAELKSISPSSKAYLCDMSDLTSVKNTCECVLTDFKGIDILVNTVGINIHGTIHDYDEKLFEKIITVNYKSGIICSQKFVPGMLERKSGNIINISSIHGSQTMPNFGVYAGTKGAVNATARAMALDYAAYGIRVNNISPGLIMSDNMMDEIETYPEGHQRDEFMELLRNKQPLEPGTMKDIANAALFLASEMSSYITGQTFFVDGGASIKAH